MNVIERGWFNLDALFTDETINFRIPSEVEYGQSVKIKFRTAKNDVDNVYIYCNNKKYVMDKIEVNDDIFDFYQFNIESLKENIEYYFVVENDNGELFYNKRGAYTDLDSNLNYKIFLDFKTPDWAKGAVIYQIMVDRFFNGDKINDVEDNEYIYIKKPVKKVDNWNKYPSVDGIREFYGGDLKGVILKLDYLRELGVDVIYFNPIFVSPSNHKYDTQDYEYVDPHIGVIKNDIDNEVVCGDLNEQAKRYIKRTTNIENLEASNELFKKLVEEAHKRGIKVILDGVFNHCGSFNKWLDREKIYKNEDNYFNGAYLDKDSPYNTYFKWKKEEWPDNEEYEGWWGHKTLPKLNYEESKLLEDKIIDIAKKWIAPPFNVDGWRLDVAADLGKTEEYNHKFWKRFREEIKSINKDAIIIAEHYGNPKKWLNGKEWDTIMNYDAFMEPVSWFLTGMEKHSEEFNQGLLGNSSSFKDAMKYNMANMPIGSIQTSMNQLSNHDHSRFLTRTNRVIGRLKTKGSQAASYNINKGIFKEAIIMQMTWPGAPTLYYGDEVGVTGWTDPDNRRTYPWGREDLELLTFYKEAIKIHKKYKVFNEGSVKVIYTDYNILAYGRWNDIDNIVIVFNNNDYVKEISLPVWQIGIKDNDILKRVLLTDISYYDMTVKEYIVKQDSVVMEMPPFSSVILVKKNK